jgi:hypothetical protein
MPGGYVVRDANGQALAYVGMMVVLAVLKLCIESPLRLT